MSTSARAARCATLFLAAAAPIAPLHAQVTQQELPIEYVRVVLQSYPSGEYLLGRMPDQLPGAAALAAGTRVIGSVVGREQSRSALAVPQPVAEARAQFEARLRTAGWTVRPLRVDEQQRGFVPAPAEGLDRGFCWPADDAQLALTVRRAPDGGSYVILQYFAAAEGRRCATAAPPPMARPRSGMEQLLPTLRPPDGAVLLPGGGGSSNNDVETRAQVTTELSTVQLIDHFAPQLREQGWTTVELLRGDALAVQYAEKQRETGTKLMLWVSAYRLERDRIFLSMRMVVAPGPS